MTVTRGIAATVIFAGLAFGTASAASADTTMSGHYIETTTNPLNGQSRTSDLNFTPCGDGCAYMTNLATGGGTRAVLVNGQWTMVSTDEAGCADGTHVDYAVNSSWTWDPNTLAGTIQATYNTAACGLPQGTTNTLNLQLRQAP